MIGCKILCVSIIITLYVLAFHMNIYLLASHIMNSQSH